MTYVHPTYIPIDRTRGFTRGLSDDPDAWKDFVISSNLSAAARRNVDRKRAEGTDPGTIYGMGYHKPKAAPRPATVRALSTAGRMREALESGPKTAAELASIVGIESSHVRPCMLYDLEKGRVVSIGDRRPLKYALASLQLAELMA